MICACSVKFWLVLKGITNSCDILPLCMCHFPCIGHIYQGRQPGVCNLGMGVVVQKPVLRCEVPLSLIYPSSKPDLKFSILRVD